MLMQQMASTSRRPRRFTRPMVAFATASHPRRASRAEARRFSGFPRVNQRVRAILLLGAASILGLALSGPPASAAAAATWHVRSGAAPGGNGSARSPFNSLAAVEAASAPGDSIVVDSGPAPLDGGIALKPGQRLMGAGGVITNTTDSHVDGDGVRLADDTTVTNLVIRVTRRGGIYGLDSVGVTIADNDVSKQNASCTKGLLVQPFNVPTAFPF